MLSENSTITNYLKNDTVELIPHVSVEFNYNLAYQPYVTYAGNGAGIDTTNYLMSDSWTSVGSKCSISQSTSGKITSSFINPLAPQFLVTPSSNGGSSVDLSDITNFQGQYKTSISTGSFVSNCYKIVFLAKSINNNIINLVAQANSSTSPLNGSAFAQIDNLDWTTVTIMVGQRPTDPTYNAINLFLDITNNNLDSLSQWGIVISQLRIYQTTYFDYCYGSLYSTDSVFSWFRPGESYVRSGNSSILDSDVYTERNLLNTTLGGSIPSGWNTQSPCSPIVYSPRVLFGASPNPIFKNGVLSPFSQYKYFVSEVPYSNESTTYSNGNYSFNYSNSKPTSIGAAYPELLITNKIVLKFNISQSIPDNLVVTLKNSTLASNNITTINVPGSWISKAGICVLYWNGSSWTNNKWAWNPVSNSGMPFIDNNGDVSMYVSGTLTPAYQNIDSISVQQLSSTPISNFSSLSTEIQDELQRFQVVEISPRLEVDISKYVISFDVKKQLDNSGTPLPISSMSANTAEFDFSNIPSYGANNYPLSLFSTNANAAEYGGYTSPFAGLLTKNVKIYGSYYLPTISNTVIPSGVFYVDTWDNSDIKVTKANCYDIMKFLQTLPVSDYVSQSQSPEKVFSTIMDISGFTDYNYDELTAALGDTNQTIDVSYFFADAANKTVYQALQEAFLAYQIGAFIDEYGVMRFKNLSTIMSTNTSSLSISDSDIVIDTYNENIKTKIGQVLMRYRGPQIKRNITASNSSNSSTSNVTSIFQIAPDIIWQQDSEDLVTYNLLKESIPNLSQNYYSTDQSTFNNLFFTTTVDHNGYCFIENEVMSEGNLEIALSAADLNGNPLGQSQLVYPSNSNDLNSYIGKFSNNLLGVSSIAQTPTGRHMNVKRGLFGTTAKAHIVMSTAADYNLSFNTQQLEIGSSSAVVTNAPGITQNLINVPSSYLARTLVVANQSDIGYSTYSAKFRFPSTKGINMHAGVFFGLNGSSTSSNTYFVEIYAKIDTAAKTKYLLNFYYINSSGAINNLTLQGGIDITSIINADFQNEPTDALHEVELGQFINLKFINNPGKRVIWINKHRILLDRKTSAVNSKGQYVYPSYWKNDSSTSSSGTEIASAIPSSFAGQNFGFFSYTDGSTTSTVTLSEIYATESAIDDSVSYYFQTREFLNSIVSGYNITERSFFVQSRPQIIGINIYDLQLALTPSLGAEMFKASYTFPYYPNNNVTANPEIIKVTEDALSYSDIASSGFRAKFAIANNSNYAVYTKTDPGYTQLADAQLLLSSRGMITLTPQLTLQKVINQQLANEVIELQSDWVQSENSADSILKILAASSDTFSKDVVVQIFGNPLIQIGDVVTLSYTLKNIVNLVFFVQEVEQNWHDGGLETTLTLNQISYAGTNRNYLPNVYVQSNNLTGSPSITSISPSSGFDTGGDTITITGTNFGSNPSLLIGNTPATIISSTSTSIVAKTPTSSVDGLVDVVVVANGNINSLPAKPWTNNIPGNGYQQFTYTASGNMIQPVSGFTMTSGSYDTAVTPSAYVYNASWTVGSTSGYQYNAFNFSVTDSNGNVVVKPSDNYDTLATGTYTTGPNFIPNTSYIATLVPEYIDPYGVITQGTAVTTKFTAPAAAGTVGTTSNSLHVSAKPSAGYYSGSNFVYDVVFTITYPTNYNRAYIYIDPSVNGGHNSSTAVYQNGNIWVTTQTVTVTGLDANEILYGNGAAGQGEHKFDIVGGLNAGPTGTIVYQTITTTPGAVLQTTAVAPSSAVISNPFYGNGTISVDIVPDSTNATYYYEIDINGVSDRRILVSTMTKNVSGNYTLVTSGTYSAGTQYAITVRSYEATQQAYSTSNTINYTTPAPAGITVALGTNGDVAFTATSTANFVNIGLLYTQIGASGHVNDSANRSIGNTWVSVNDGTVLSTDGLNFNDPRLEPGGTYASLFNPGTVTIDISAYGPNSLIYATAKGTTTIANVNSATPPTMYPYDTNGSKYFTWYDGSVTGGSGTIYGYQVQLYKGTSTSGTAININGGSGYRSFSGIDSTYAYFISASPSRYYQIETGTSGTLYCRVRLIYAVGSTYYASTWTSATVS